MRPDGFFYLKDGSGDVWKFQREGESIIFDPLPNTYDTHDIYKHNYKKFGISASYSLEKHYQSCRITEIDVPKEFCRRGIGTWMVNEVVKICRLNSIQIISGIVQSNGIAFPFWASFNPKFIKTTANIDVNRQSTEKDQNTQHISREFQMDLNGFVERKSTSYEIRSMSL